ncbi:MAG: 23S rRNA pseudouridine(955/2504/2580) synthase RluC [Zetaproteobacteria bacterium]|nr:MAG: 23S rRNA pseudouridine(955/2504/2580) synthase RluC [Zetaproteobacteria bacterium]
MHIWANAELLLTAKANGKGGALARKKGGDSRIVVDAEEVESRLDRMLLRRLGASFRPLIMRLIRRGNVRVNGKRAKPETRLHQGDEIFLPVSLRQSEVTKDTRSTSLPTPVAMRNMAILFEDADILVINKPAGVVVHGGSGHGTGVIESLRESMRLSELRLAHRLDRDTSGCLLMAKRLSVLRALTAEFRERRAHKTYLAWVAGHPYPYAGRMQSTLAKGVLRGGERMVIDGEKGKKAVADYQVSLLAERDDWSFALLALQPESGRTHQLRVQLQAEGHAILGDEKYGLREDNRHYRNMGGKCMALHAWRLRFEHPARHHMVEVRAPWPAAWTKVF